MRRGTAVRSGRAALAVSAGTGAPPFAGTESQHQRALLEWARWMRVARDVVALDHLFAVPNGGLRHPATAAKLKAEGLVPGVPDLLLLWPCDVVVNPAPVDSRYHGCVIEMKAPRETLHRVTEAQWVWLRRLAWSGYSAHVAFGVDAAKGVLDWYLGLKLRDVDGVIDGVCVTDDLNTPAIGPWVHVWRPVRELDDPTLKEVVAGNKA